MAATEETGASASEIGSGATNPVTAKDKSSVNALTSQRTAVETQIASRRRQITALQDEVQGLSTELNRLTPAGRLPREVLGEIFTLVRDNRRLEYDSAADDDYQQQPYQWLGLSHVCHDWRDAALGHAALWTWIVPIRHEATLEFLARSGQCALDVSIRRIRPSHDLTGVLPRLWDEEEEEDDTDYGSSDDDEDDDAAEAFGAQWQDKTIRREKAAQLRRCCDKTHMIKSLDAVFKNLPRIRSLILDSEYPIPEATPEDASMLRTLTLRGRDSTKPVLGFFERIGVPALTGLHLVYHPHHLRPFFNSRLTELSLLAVRMVDIVGQSVFSDASFLAVLENCPRLRSLEIVKLHDLLYPPWQHDVHATQRIPTPTRIVTLAQLEHLHISDEGDGSPSAVFLSHLQVDANKICIRVETKSKPHICLGVQLFSTVGYLGVPHSHLAAAIDGFPNYSVEFNIWSAGSHLDNCKPYEEWGTPRLSCRVAGGVRHTTPHRPRMGMDLIPVDYNDPEDIVLSFLDWLPASRISAFALGVRLGPGSWRTAFSGMINVSQLHLQGRSSASPMFFTSALAPADAKSLGHTGWKDPKARMLFPSLGTLVVDRMVWAPPPATASPKRQVLTDKGIPTNQTEARETFARALAKRGGLQQLIVRHGRRDEEVDVEFVVHEGNVANVAWDGLERGA